MSRGFILKLVRDETAAAAVEMALMLPLLLALMFSGLEGAYYLYLEHQVVKGVRDGARFAARQNFTYFSCGSTSVSSTTVSDNIKNVTRTGSVSSSASARVPGWTSSGVTVTVSCPGTAVQTGIYKSLTNAPQVTVSATVAYPSLFSSLSGFGTSINLTASQQAAVVGI